jgi:hypothetical protein
LNQLKKKVLVYNLPGGGSTDRNVRNVNYLHFTLLHLLSPKTSQSDKVPLATKLFFKNRFLFVTREQVAFQIGRSVRYKVVLSTGETKEVPIKN